MSGHCPNCGVYAEEDDNRLCGRCASDFTAPIDQNNTILAALTASLLAEREATRVLQKIVEDYTILLKQRQDSEQAAKELYGEPLAWIVYEPEGSEYDYSLFSTEAEARVHAECLDAYDEEGSECRRVIPLYMLPDNNEKV